MKNVYIAKTAIATGLGETLEDNWLRLNQAQSAIDTILHFSTDRLPYHHAACLPDLRQSRTTDHTRALMQRVLDHIKPIPANTDIIWTGIKGNAEAIENGGDNTNHYLPAQYRQWVADTMGTTARGVTVNAACAAATVGLALGAQKIALGDTDNVLVCGADLVSRFVHTGFSALKALTKTTCRPFDRQRDGMCLGDGAFAILLTGTQAAKEETRTFRVRLAGWGIANDAVHITGPARDGRGLTAAVRTALEMAAVPPDEVEAFCAHGTGTVYNDGMEMAAINTLFGDRRFPVFSIKGAIGHTLGAAGGIETALCHHALAHKYVPPTIGSKDPERAATGRVLSATQHFGGHNILTTNSGFGGVNGALLLQTVAPNGTREKQEPK